MLFLLLIPLVAFVVGTAVNMFALSAAYDGRDVQTILGVPAAEADVSHVQALDHASFVQLFLALGAASEVKFPPQGNFVAENLAIGLPRFFGAQQISDNLMSDAGAWAGKWFKAGAGSARPGGNLFRTPAGQSQTLVRDLPFVVRDAAPSVLDGQPCARIDYSQTNNALMTFMGDELRCVSEKLCVGFGGFSFSAGVRNGSPFVVHAANGIQVVDKSQHQDKEDL